jgi:hypothetical protein
MDGVILFVDDKVHECCAKENEIERTPENALFESLRKDYPVLGVKDLDLAQRAIKSIGAFSAIILDWIFEDTRDALGEATEEDIRAVRRGSVQEDQTLTFLEENDFFSLVYVYSNEDVEGKYGTRLRTRFGDRIQIQRKTTDGISAQSIIAQIEEWSGHHRSLTIPLAWTATINQALQQIFKELATADKNWIKEIGHSAKEDGVSGEVFIIEILQYLLAESLVQNRKLLDSIKDYLAASDEAEEPPSLSNEEPVANSNEESVTKLFRRLFYTKIDPESPIMTGDICDLSDTKFGIVVTPECDVQHVVTGKIASFEVITFSKNSFDDYLQDNTYQRSDYGEASAKLLTKLRKAFNQDESKYHVLPSFPFDETSLNLSVRLDFSQGCERYKFDEIKTSRRYKLNSPFIQQLRQRYIAHLGRVGVPSLPPSLRNFNLK